MELILQNTRLKNETAVSAEEVVFMKVRMKGT
jgi:hypothetical protein